MQDGPNVCACSSPTHYLECLHLIQENEPTPTRQQPDTRTRPFLRRPTMKMRGAQITRAFCLLPLTRPRYSGRWLIAALALPLADCNLLGSIAFLPMYPYCQVLTSLGSCTRRSPCSRQSSVSIGDGRYRPQPRAWRWPLRRASHGS